MPADTTTPNYGWVQPAVGADATVWGTKLNQTIAAIDSQVFSNEQGVLPIGSGALWFTNTPPANWLLCQGQTLAQASYPALYNAIGGLYNVGTVASGYFMLPNLTQTFPLGAIANGAGATGGTFSYTLSVANLPAHAHPIIDVAHNHGASQPAHNHPDQGHNHGGSQAPHAHGNVQQSNTGNYYTFTGNAWFGPGVTDTQQPAVTIAVGYANPVAQQPAITVNPSGTGLSTTQNTGGGAAMSIVPPFLAINFIIRYQ